MRKPKPNEIYRHFKGNLYQVVTLATHTETEEELVIYQALYGDLQVYARPLSMFVSPVDQKKYPESTQKYRFERVETLSVQGNPDMQSLPKEPEAEQTKPDQPSGIKEEAEELNIDPLVLEFLDADTYEARLNILAALHHRITDDMINTMAAAMDVEVEAGELEERYSALKICLLTLDKYECSRMR
ncbi:MAG: DUF1653 domain-containing protein [Clostridiales bacterium]|nr:DUF1653 domain-containing protein [Clostridiales bacterium]